MVGDGRADLAVGAPHENGATGAYSLFPGTGSLIGAGTVAIGPHPTSRLGMSVAVVAGELLAGLPGDPGPAALPGAAHCDALLVADANPQVLHQDTVAPAVAGVREVAWTPMPWDDTLGEPETPDTEPGGEWFGWSVAH